MRAPVEGLSLRAEARGKGANLGWQERRMGVWLGLS